MIMSVVKSGAGAIPISFFTFFGNLKAYSIATHPPILLPLSIILLILRDLEQSEIKDLISKDINNAKKRLAYLVTADCHSENSAQEAENKAVSIFEKKSHEDLEEIVFENNQNIKILEALISHKLVPSKSEAKRLIEGGGIKINDNQIKDFNFILNQSNHDDVLKIGKKKLFKIKFN